MHYVKMKTVVTCVVDEMVEDLETIKAILSVVKEKELTCTMRLTEGPKMEQVRIEQLTEDSLSFRVIFKQHSLKKSCKYADIDYLEVNTEDAAIVNAKPGISRWLLLDPSANTGEQV